MLSVQINFGHLGSISVSVLLPNHWTCTGVDGNSCFRKLPPVPAYFSFRYAVSLNVFSSHGKGLAGKHSRHFKSHVLSEGA